MKSLLISLMISLFCMNYTFAQDPCYTWGDVMNSCLYDGTYFQRKTSAELGFAREKLSFTVKINGVTYKSVDCIPSRDASKPSWQQCKFKSIVGQAKSNYYDVEFFYSYNRWLQIENGGARFYLIQDWGDLVFEYGSDHPVYARNGPDWTVEDQPPKVTGFREDNNQLIWGHDIHKLMKYSIRYSPTMQEVLPLPHYSWTKSNSFSLTDHNPGYYQVVARDNWMRLSSASNVVYWPGISNEGLKSKPESQIKSIESYLLNQNYPNPFNPSTTINYSLAEPGFVNLIVTDLLGNEIKTLVNEVQGEGAHRVLFDGSDLPSGVYIYRIQTDRFTDAKKMILTK